MRQRFLLLTTVLQLEPPIFKSLRMPILSNGTVGDKGNYHFWLENMIPFILHMLMLEG